MKYLMKAILITSTIALPVLIVGNMIAMITYFLSYVLLIILHNEYEVVNQALYDSLVSIRELLIMLIISIFYWSLLLQININYAMSTALLLLYLFILPIHTSINSKVRQKDEERKRSILESSLKINFPVNSEIGWEDVLNKAGFTQEEWEEVLRNVKENAVKS